MLRFVQRHAEKVTGVLHGFDRLRFRGTLRNLMFTEGMSEFLWKSKVLLKDFKTYFGGVTQQVKAAIEQTAKQAGRPLRYLASSNIDKEPVARKIAADDRIEEGLLCVLRCIENCQSFEVRPNREKKRLELRFVPRKCLPYYFYLRHPRFGFMHVRFQSWFPFDVRVCLNGREWLCRELDRAGIGYLRRENCLIDVTDMHRRAEVSQAANERYLDSLASVDETTPLAELTSPLCKRTRFQGRSVRALNPLATTDAQLLETVNLGEFAINGFRNRDLQTRLYSTKPRTLAERRRRSARTSRQLRMLRAHGLIKKVAKSHRYQLTDYGRSAITALLAARQADTMKLTAAA